MSFAQNLLNLTRDTDLALREGRLGANEWFDFLQSIEELAHDLSEAEKQIPSALPKPLPQPANEA